MALKRVLFHTTILSGIAFSASAAIAGPLSPLIVDDGNSFDVSNTQAYSSIWIGEHNPEQEFNVLSGGDLSSTGVVIGLNPGAGDNTVTVSGTGVWNNDTNILIGDKAGGNTFTIENGGTVNSNSTWLGSNTGAEGNTLNVSGGTLSNVNQLVIGGTSGGNSVTISNAGTATSVLGYVGFGADAGDNDITVTGAGSTWTVTDVLKFGYEGGDNTLDVLAGGKLAVGADMVIGVKGDAGGNEVTASGSGSQIAITKTLYVGQSSDDNSLTIANGATLTTKNARIGGGGDAVATSSGNSITVTGSGSSWTSNGTLRIGDGTSYASSDNTLTVADGGTVTFTDSTKGVFIGFSSADEDNALIVTGEGSSFTAAGAIYVGASNYGDGSYTQAHDSLLEVSEGGNVTSAVVAVGGDSKMRVGAGSSVTTGNLILDNGATLGVELSDSDPALIAAASASLDGTLEAEIGAGGLLSNRYDVISYGSYSGGFDDLELTGYTEGYTTNYTATIGYDANAAYVLFNANLGAGEKLNGNQGNVAGALDDYFNDGGVFTTAIAGLYGLTGDELKSALTQASGELGATGGVNAIERATTSFLNLMLGGGGQSAAPGSAHRMASGATVDTGIVPTADVPPAQGGWSMWGGVYGGAANLPGSSSKGSHDTDTTVGGIAAGFDYDIAPETRVGLALAGGRTSWDLDAGLGSGDSTFFQLGAYGTQHFGASYLSLGGAYAWHSMSTDRKVNIDGSEKLDADFDAGNLSGRIEAGHRFAASEQLGLTPYAAFQAQGVYMPGYREHGATKDESFALSYESETATALRSEVGFGIDTALGMDPAAASLFGRVAWAHDWNSDANVQASFVALDMGTFTVNGAEAPANLALVTAGAEFGLSQATRLAATFDGEFGDDYQSYAGSVTLRYSW